VVAQLDEKHANSKTASVLEWYDRHRAAHNIWFKRRRRTIQGILNFFKIIFNQSGYFKFLRKILEGRIKNHFLKSLMDGFGM